MAIAIDQRNFACLENEGITSFSGISFFFFFMTAVDIFVMICGLKTSFFTRKSLGVFISADRPGSSLLFLSPLPLFIQLTVMLKW